MNWLSQGVSESTENPSLPPHKTPVYVIKLSNLSKTVQEIGKITSKRHLFSFFFFSIFKKIKPM